MNWRFRYRREDREVAGFAALGTGRPLGSDWEVPVECDLHGSVHPIAGASAEHAVELGKEFLRSLYQSFELRTTDGRPFAWSPEPRP